MIMQRLKYRDSAGARHDTYAAAIKSQFMILMKANFADQNTFMLSEIADNVRAIEQMSHDARTMVVTEYQPLSEEPDE